MALTREYGLSAPFAYDRKEPKEHGEGGQVVGALHAFDRKPLLSGSTPSASNSSKQSSGGDGGENSSSSGIRSGGSGVSSTERATGSSSNASGCVDKTTSSRCSSTTRPARVLLLDDVLTAGTAIRGSLKMLRTQFPDIQIAALCLLLDRQERDSSEENLSASQKLEAEVNMKVLSVLHMADILLFLDELIATAEGEEKKRVEEARRNLLLYLEKYGGLPVVEGQQPTAKQ